MLRGFAAATERFAVAARSREPDTAFFALFEALNWAAAADDLIAKVWRPEGRREGFDWRRRVQHGDVMDGVRYVRNLVHHQWADALDLVNEARYPRRYPRRYFAWIWRASSELPDPASKRDRARQAAYDTSLAGLPAEDTLLRLGEAFGAVARFLHPPRSRPGQTTVTFE